MSYFDIALLPDPGFSPVIIPPDEEMDPTVVATIAGHTYLGTPFMIGAITIPREAIFYNDCTSSDGPIDCSDCSGIDLPPDADPPFPPVYPYPWTSDVMYGRDHLSLNLKMVRGDTYKFDATIVLNSIPYDLTGCTLYMTAKWVITDTDAAYVFQLNNLGSGITVTSAVDGEISVTIAGNLTQDLPSKKVELPYDIELVSTTGERFTVLYGILTIVPDVTITPAV